jgi:hypothetical protein
MSEPFEGAISYAEQHPWLVGGCAIAIVAALWIITHRGGGGGSAGSSGVDPSLAALYAQQQQTGAALQGQAAQLSAQITTAGIQKDYGLALATIQTNAQTQQTNTAASVALATIQANADVETKSLQERLAEAGLSAGVATTQIQANLSATMDTNATMARMHEIIAQEQVGIANLNAQTLIALSNNQTQVALGQTNASVSVAGYAAGAQKNANDNQLTGQLAQAGLMALMMI